MSQLKGEFLDLIMRFKKIDICPSMAERLQPSELAVMARTFSSCTCSADGVCVSQIHQTLYVSKAAVSQTLNTLEKKGYIVRQIDPNDRRKIIVTVTTEGEAELDIVQKMYNETLDLILGEFGQENTETLIELIEKLMNIVDEMHK